MTDKEKLKEKLKDPAYRHAYAEAFLDSSIALQVKALREQRGWTQKQLGARAEMKQSRISTMEQADYSAWSIKTLRRLAKAFDLILLVRFEEWGKLLGGMGTLKRSNLTRISFSDDPVFLDNAAAATKAGDFAQVFDIAGHQKYKRTDAVSGGGLNRAAPPEAALRR